MNLCGKLIAVVLVCSLGTIASAEVIHYGDFDGAMVQFLNVQESGVEVSGVTEPLYGDPTPAGNTLLFNPVSFGVMSTGFDNNLCDGTLTATIVADQGYGLDAIEIIEAGDYIFVGQGTSATSVSVTLSGFITILEINGQPVNVLDPQYRIDFSKNVLSANLVDDGLLGDLWSGYVFKNFDAITGYNQAVTKFSINLDNILCATSEVGTSAFVAKKQFQLRAYASNFKPVPEPSTLVLLGLGAFSLLFFRRAGVDVRTRLSS